MSKPTAHATRVRKGPVRVEIKAKPKSRRGFASMPPEERARIASMGGKAAHAGGRAHQYTPDEAREAGRKGGVAVSKNREHMAAIGAKGGRVAGVRKFEKRQDAAPEQKGTP
jgi:general stress protein YciG